MIIRIEICLLKRLNVKAQNALLLANGIDDEPYISLSYVSFPFVYVVFSPFFPCLSVILLFLVVPLIFLSPSISSIS